MKSKNLISTTICTYESMVGGIMNYQSIRNFLVLITTQAQDVLVRKCPLGITAAVELQ